MDNLRPLEFEDFIGQADAIRKLQVAITSAQKRGKPMGHILFTGPAGLGKTTLSQIVANTIKCAITFTIGNNIGNDVDLFNLIDKTVAADVSNILFIDEIHTIRPAAQNNLLTAMEDHTIFVKKNGRSRQYKFPAITFVGATTDPGGILKPVYERFDHKIVLVPYSVSELQDMVKFTVSRLDYVDNIDDDAAIEIAKRARGVARIATKHCKSAQDIACMQDKKVIDMAVVEETFDMLDIDEKGLSRTVDIKILKYLFNIYPSSVGTSSMAQLLDEDPRHIAGVIEPNLFKLGYIDRGRGGRTITPKGMAYLKEQGHINATDVGASQLVLVN